MFFQLTFSFKKHRWEFLKIIPKHRYVGYVFNVQKVLNNEPKSSGNMWATEVQGLYCEWIQINEFIIVPRAHLKRLLPQTKKSTEDGRVNHAYTWLSRDDIKWEKLVYRRINIWKQYRMPESRTALYSIRFELSPCAWILFLLHE